MALVRLAMKNVQQRVVSPSSCSLLSQSFSERSLSAAHKQRWGSELVKSLSTTTEKTTQQLQAEGAKSSDNREVSVSEGAKKSKLFPSRKGRKGLWRNNDPQLVPSLHEFIPSGLGDAIVQATHNMTRLLEKLAPSRLLGRFKEKDECYMMKFEVPGISKEDIKITVVDGVLTIVGEHKEEEEEGSDDEFWSARTYGFYNTSIILPEDAKVDEIKAEMKDGVLLITIPKSEEKKKDVKEVQVQ
ncbi:26.5 kDa heat shock protein, mitochondrial [Cornus florida]|uniref:26.5 kDa heat shock protein, mitochondrial n=1 Tax=Cornus florida TaxID=4283 RepID=UPI00289A8DC3|nr:26.5 kDa heat shock protein, mitochondrial [Cornus florida]